MWKRLTNARLLWLKAFGFVEFQKFSLLYSITDQGKSFLANIDIVEEIKKDFDDDETAGETGLEVSDWAFELSKNKTSKKSSIGDIPGNLIDFDNTIREYLEVMRKGATYENILNFSDVNLGVAQSSLRSFLTTLSNMGFVERKTDVLNEERNNIIRYGKLLHAVMDCLAEESEDPVTGGLLQDRDIYRSLRNSKEFDYAPTIEEISDMLSFLASPLIGCVDKSKEGFYAVGSVEDAAKKFEFYSKACKVK